MSPAMSPPSLAEISLVAYRYKLLLALSFLLPVVASIAIAFTMTPTYEAVGRLLVQTGREYMPRPEIGGSTQSAPSTSMKETVDTEVQLLTSKDLMRSVVRAVTAERLYPKLAGTPARGGTLENSAVKAFSQDLSVSPVRLTDVIEVALRNSNREVAEEALRVLIDRFKAMHVQAFSQNRRPVLEHLASQDEALLATLQRQRAEYAAGHGLYALAEQRSQLVQQHAKDLQDLRSAEQRKASIEAQLRSITTELERQPATITLQTTSQNSATADDAQKRARDLSARRQEALARGLGPGLPAVAGLTAELNSVQRTLAQTRARDIAVTAGVNPVATALKVQLASLETDLAPLAGTIAALQTTLGTYDAQLRRLGQDEITLRDYDQRISDMQATTTTTRQRLADARYIDDLDRAEVGSVKEVQSPTGSDQPVRPNKRLIGAGGVLVGLFASAFSLLIALTFGNNCLTAETVERLLGTPVLAILPKSPQSRARLVRPQGLVLHRDTHALPQD